MKLAELSDCLPETCCRPPENFPARLGKISQAAPPQFGLSARRAHSGLASTNGSECVACCLGFGRRRTGGPSDEKGLLPHEAFRSGKMSPHVLFPVLRGDLRIARAQSSGSLFGDDGPEHRTLIAAESASAGRLAKLNSPQHAGKILHDLIALALKHPDSQSTWFEKKARVRFHASPQTEVLFVERFNNLPDADKVSSGASTGSSRA